MQEYSYISLGEPTYGYKKLSFGSGLHVFVDKDVPI
jgi:hypothetical protein